MVDVRPFKALKPTSETCHQVASPPWDVLTEKEIHELADSNPASLLHVTRPEILWPDKDPLRAGKENLERLIKDKLLVKDDEEAFYIYRIETPDHQQTGLLAAVSCQDYWDGKILLHEKTLAKKEDDRAQLIAAQEACVEPVFFFCRDQEFLNFQQYIGETPHLVNRDEKGVTHSLWKVKDPQQIKNWQSSFLKMEFLYIADGHHRTAGAARYHQQRNSSSTQKLWTPMLATIFPESQVRILAYNRVIRDLGDMTAEEFLEKLRQDFSIEPITQPGPSHGQIDLYLDSTWYRLTALTTSFANSSISVDSLDVSILQKKILEPLLGISDPRRDARVDFIGGDQGPEGLVKRCQEGWSAAFLLHPVSIETLREVAEAQGIMPPKSTWFDPKLRSGLMILPIE